MPPLSFLFCCRAGLSFRCSINLWDECAAMRSCANWNAAASMRNGRNWPGTLQLKEGSRNCARRTDGKPPMFRNRPCSHWRRSEEHTSELQSLMRISYAVFCLKKKKKQKKNYENTPKIYTT